MSTTASQAERYLQASVLSKQLYTLLLEVDFNDKDCPWNEITLSNARHDLASMAYLAEQQQED
jgi:hypothetical protein